MMDGIVGVFGANGHTGRFVANELKRRGIEGRWIGRNLDGVRDLQSELGHGDFAVATVDNRASLRAAFAGLDAIINCAGPFFDTSKPVISAALEAGCHVLDVTAEQVTVLNTISTFDEPARNAGRVVLPAMAFFGGLADLLATTLAADWSEIDTIETAVALSFWHPTDGTRQTGERNTAARLLVRHGQLTPAPSPPLKSDWLFPDPFGQMSVTSVVMSEIILMSRHLTAKSITSWMTEKPLLDLGDSNTPSPVAIDAQGRSAQAFALCVRAIGEGEVREAAVIGQDIYAVTAPLVVEAAAQLIAGGSSFRGGVFAPGEIFDAHKLLSGLCEVLTPA